MLSKAIQEMLDEWASTLDEIRKKIDDLNGQKREAAADVQTAIKGKKADEVISARQIESKLDEEIQALRLIEAEIAGSYPVDHGTFLVEYQAFQKQYESILDQKYTGVVVALTELEGSYTAYDHVYAQYTAKLKPWQELATKIGLNQPSVFADRTMQHRKFKRDIGELTRRPL